MGVQIHFQRPDGKQAQGYFARAALDHPPGVVVIQEWWGVQTQIKNMSDRLAANGFDALAPDLYAGKIIDYHHSPEAEKEMNSLNFLDAVDQTTRGAALFLRQANSKVAITGFCMGGAMVIMAAARVPEFCAGVAFYGLPPESVARPADVKIPLQGHFANHDDWCTPPVAAAFDKGLTAAGKPHEFYHYDAAHAFMNEEREEAYNRPAAELAWKRTLAFLKTHV